MAPKKSNTNKKQPTQKQNGGVPMYAIGGAVAMVAVAVLFYIESPSPSSTQADSPTVAPSSELPKPSETKKQENQAQTEKKGKPSQVESLDQWAQTFSKKPSLDATTVDFLRSLPPNPVFSPIVDIANKYDTKSTIAKQIVKKMKKISSKPRQELLYMDMMLWKKLGEAINPDSKNTNARNFFSQCVKSLGSQKRIDESVMEGGWTHLLQAIRAGDVDVVGSLLVGGANINIVNTEGVGAVDLAIARWSSMQQTMHNAQCHPGFGINLRKLLRTKDLDTAFVNFNGDNLLRSAVDARHFEAVKTLINLDPSLAAQTSKATKATVLHSIVDPSSQTITGAKWLINHGNVAQHEDYECKHNSVNDYNMSKDSILHSQTFSRHHDHTALAAEVHDWLAPFVEILIEAGTDVNAKDMFGRTALHVAATHGNTPAVARLLAAGANALAQDKAELTPIDYAQNAFYMDVAKLIWDAAPVGSVTEPVEPTFTTTTVPRQNGALKDWGNARTVAVTPADDVDNSECDVDVRDDLEYPEFVSKYWNQGRPVLIRGGLKSLVATGDLRFWGRQALGKHLNGKALKSAHVETEIPTNSSEMTLEAYWAYMEKQQHKLNEPYSESSSSEDTIIETDWDLTAEAAKTLSKTLKVTPAGWLLRDTNISPLRLNNVQINVAPPYAGTSFHFHHATMSALVQGRKRWFLSRPSEAFYSNAHFFDDFKSIKESKLGRPLQCTQQSLDVLFLPSMWGHAVLYEENSIATSFLYTSIY